MLDTHLLAWLASDRKRLKAAERAAIEAYSDDLVASVISIWELRLKWRSNPSRAATDGLIRPDEALLFASRRGIFVAPLTGDQVAAAIDPPVVHRDPFDEMLLVHAGQLDAKLLTRDKYLRVHPLAYPL